MRKYVVLQGKDQGKIFISIPKQRKSHGSASTKRNNAAPAKVVTVEGGLQTKV